jgi:serine protease Do
MLQDEANAKEAPADEECNGLAQLFGLCHGAVEHVKIELKDMPIHFVQENESMGVSKEPSAWHVGKVVGWALDRDLALIEAVGKAVPEHEYATLASDDPAMMESLTVVGHPKGLYWTYMTGSCAGVRDTLPHMSKSSEGDKRIGPFLQVEAPVYFGNSGGGAFNDRGELVGIASFLLRLPGEGFFIGRESMHAFLVDQKFYKQ